MSDAEDGREEGPETPSPRPTPVRRSAPKPARPRRASGGPASVRDTDDEASDDGSSSRPTPVRLAMEPERETLQPIETPTLHFEQDGEEWIAREEGRTVAGFRNDGGAPLIFVTFARAEEPERRLREIVAVGRSLETLDPGRLGVLLHDARPYDDAWEGSELFPETRKSRQSRR